MAHLTRILLDYETAASYRMQDAYAWHQRLWEAFSHFGQGANVKGPLSNCRPFLTRLDHLEGGYQVLMLSEREPLRPSWCQGRLASWQTKRVADALLEHLHYRFKLRANPTKKVSAAGPDGKRLRQGKRVALRSASDLEAWFLRKATASGFALDPGSLNITERGPICFVKRSERLLGTLNIVDFEGVLHVTDRMAFKKSFQNGIGSAKAFGCGMLLLEPLG